jgi:glucose/arabinose dehydrogenase
VAGQYVLAPSVSTADFEKMLGLYPYPGAPDEALVITQTGYIRRVSLSGAFAPALFADLRDRVLIGGEEGLLALAYSPQFATDGEVYIYYNAPKSSPEFYARLSVPGNSVLDNTTEQVLLSIGDPGAWHNRPAGIRGDSYLYLSVGSSCPNGQWFWDNGQDMTKMFGKVLRLDVSGPQGYTIPPDNPFIDGPGGNRDEIWALGFRNPWRGSFDSATGQLWLGDVGPWRWEEVNRVGSKITAGTSWRGSGASVGASATRRV